jgi:hypothetical protein
MGFMAALMMAKPNQESSTKPIALMAPQHVHRDTQVDRISSSFAAFEQLLLCCLGRC